MDKTNSSIKQIYNSNTTKINQTNTNLKQTNMNYLVNSRRILFLFCLLLTFIGASGQAVLFSEDFEGVNSFTSISGRQPNKWYVGAAIAKGGGKSAYITSNNDSYTYTYTNANASTVHLYRDVFIPPTEECTLSFDWKSSDKNVNDYMQVYLVETSVNPVAGSVSNLGTALGKYSMQSSWQQAFIGIPKSATGTTKRLVFTWTNDNTTGVKSMAIDNILMTVATDPCAHTSSSIVLNTTNPIRWERSVDNGKTWENINCKSNVYVEESPDAGTFVYRAFNEDGTYSASRTVTYQDAVPGTINTLPFSNTKTVDEEIVFTLGLNSGSYNYQWYKNKEAITGATKSTYAINSIRTADEGVYHCVVWNDCNTASSNPSTLTVTKAQQIITFEELPVKIYGNADFRLPEKTDKGLLVNYLSTDTSTAVVSGNWVTIKNPGSAVIIASQAGDADYLPANTIERNLTVNKQNQTIVFGEFTTKSFGDPSITLPATTSKGLPILYQSTNTQVATISNNVLIITGAGESDIIATQEGDNFHYTALPITQALKVNKLPQYITFPPIDTRTYGDADILLNELSDAGLEINYESNNTDVVEIEGNVVKLRNAGTALITATQTGNKNYFSASEITRMLVIQQAPQTIFWENIEPVSYGKPDFALPKTTDKGLTITYTSADESIVKVVNNIVQIKKAGVTTITAQQDGDNNYTAAQTITHPISVSKAFQTIMLGELSEKTLGDADFTLPATTSAGLPIVYESSNTHVAEINGNVVRIKNTGETYITASASGNENYFTANMQEQLLRVKKAAQNIELTQIPSKTYGDPIFSLQAKVNTNMPISYKSSDPTKLFVSGNQAIIIGAGTVTITAEQAGSNNYMPTADSQTLTINKANATVTVNNAQRVQGKENPEFTYSITGLIKGDTQASIETLPTVTTAATANSAKGKYDIIASDAFDSNYSFIYKPGKLTVKRK